MTDNPLIQLLSTFSRKEMTRFVEFSQSPYFCKHQNVQDLVVVLNKIYPEFSGKKCSKKQLWKTLYGTKTHAQPQLALVFTYTLRLLESFLKIEKFREQEAIQNQLLLAKLREKRVNKFYEKHLQKAKKELLKTPFRAVDYLENQYRLATEADAWHSLLAQHKKEDSLQKKQDFLDYWFIAEKLKDGCEMLLRSKILKVEYQAGLLPQILEAIQINKEKYEQIPSILIYQQIYQMVTTGNPSDFFQLKTLLQTQEIHFPKAELQNIYNYFQNFCIEQINRGNEDFMGELFQIYQSQLEKELIFEHDDFLLEWHYKNVATVGLRLKEFAWTRQFIESYRARLKPDIADNAYRFSLASWHYAMKEYQEVLSLLLQVEFTDIRYSLDAKALLLRTYFDLEEYDAFMSLSEAFRQFLQRNRVLSDFQRKGYENLIKLSRKAFQLRKNKSLKTDKKWLSEKTKLHNRIEETDPVFNKIWLLQRLSF